MNAQTRLERCLASSVAKAMEDKCEAEGVATPWSAASLARPKGVATPWSVASLARPKGAATPWSVASLARPAVGTKTAFDLKLL